MIPKELLKRLRRIEIHTARLANDQLVGAYASVFKGRGLAFDEVRLYQPGDDVRFIDWNVTARSGEPHVKVFREEREMTVMLVVDMSGSQAFGTRGLFKRELVAEVSAVLAFSAVKNNDRVGLVLFTDDVEKVIAPKKGPRHVMRVVAETLQFHPRGRGTNLTRALEALSHLSRRRAVTFVVSDFLSDGYEHALRVAAARHDVVPVSVGDPREDDLADVGIAWCEDLETGALIPVDTSSPRVRDAFRRKVTQQRAGRDTLFRRLGLDHISIQTHRPYITPLAEFFRRRARRMHLG
ncbi:MAG: DUF58 domain-containing protein [Deltaproteobacteria bacterium]|nr:DUF58 domain-containing protein [Deltaproteobacteria bacterium]